MRKICFFYAHVGDAWNNHRLHAKIHTHTHTPRLPYDGTSICSCFIVSYGLSSLFSCFTMWPFHLSAIPLYSLFACLSFDLSLSLFLYFIFFLHVHLLHRIVLICWCFHYAFHYKFLGWKWICCRLEFYFTLHHCSFFEYQPVTCGSLYEYSWENTIFSPKRFIRCAFRRVYYHRSMCKTVDIWMVTTVIVWNLSHSMMKHIFNANIISS